MKTNTLQMRTTAAMCIFFFLFSMAPIAAFSQWKDIEKMLAVIREEERTWSSGDIEGYVNLYAPDDSTRMILSKGAA